MIIAENKHRIADTFGTPLRFGDRILKSRVSKYGGFRAWLLVVGFTERPDGFPVLVTRRIYGFNRPHRKDKVAVKGVRQPATLTALRNPKHVSALSSHATRHTKASSDRERRLHVSRKLGEHTNHYGYLVDHEWRKNRHEKSCCRFGNQWSPT